MKRAACAVGVLACVSLVAPERAAGSPILTIGHQDSASATILDGTYILDFTGRTSGAAASSSTGSAGLDLFAYDVSPGGGSDTPLQITFIDDTFTFPAALGASLTANGEAQGSLLSLGGDSNSFESWASGAALYTPNVFSNGAFETPGSVASSYTGPFTYTDPFRPVATASGSDLPDWLCWFDAEACQPKKKPKLGAVPEPASIGLFGLGLVALAGLVRRKRLPQS